MSTMTTMNDSVTSASSSSVESTSLSMSSSSEMLTTHLYDFTTMMMNETETEFVSDTVAIIMSVFLNIIAVLGIVGNSVVVLSVMFSRKLQTATNVFVIALSVTDLLVCLTLPFQTIALTSVDGWPLPDWLCATIGGITSICFGASVLLLVLIAVNRYYVITRSRSICRRFYKTRNLALMVTSAYVYTVVMFAVLPIAGIGMLGYSDSYRICAWDEEHELGEVNDYIVALTFGVSFIIIVVCYVRIFLFVRQHHRVMMAHRAQNGLPADHDFTSMDQTDTQEATMTTRVATANANNANNANNKDSNITEGRRTSEINQVVSRREVEITKNLFIVVCSFFICIAPYSVCLALPTGASVNIFTGILLMANAFINPVIYSFKHPTFKVVIKCVLCCRYANIPKPSKTLKKLLKLRGSGS